MTDVSVNVDNASSIKIGPSIDPGQALPEHPLRNTWTFQILDRCWRLFIYWSTGVGVAYVCFLGYMIGKPMPLEPSALVLTFAGGMIGVKTFEKLRSVA